MAVKISSVAGFFSLNVWILANIVQEGTNIYCKRFLNLKNDPGGRLYDQMYQAARSITANIAEGTSRHQTSVESEMKLLDVARASASELWGDYFSAILHHRQAPWPKSHPDALMLNKTDLDRPDYGEDLAHDAGLHILSQLSKFDRWILEGDELACANCLLILTKRVQQMLDRLLQRCLEDFKQEGGFRENMTKERIAVQQEQARQQAAPTCPVCGKPMKECTAGIGHHQGHKFWGCTDYPNCKGMRETDGTPIARR